MGKKIGNFFLSLTPAITCIVLQLGIGMVVGMAYSVIYMMQTDLQDAEALNQMIQEASMAASAPSVFCYHILGILVFGLWYYFGCKRKKPAKLKIMADVKFWGSAVLGALIFITVNYTVIYFLNGFFPEMVRQYMESWNYIQISNQGLLYFTTIFLAPIGEEIMLRGITLYYARKCTKHFWIANIIQAFLFGLIHLNLIQGIYAFLGGLILGWLYKKYNSIYIVILVHFLVNLSASTWADSVFTRVPDQLGWWLLLAAGAAVSLLVLLLWNGEFRKKEALEEVA